MDVRDEELVRRLAARDGPPAERSWSHTDITGACRYAHFYPDGDCPWCAAEARRQRESARASDAKPG